MIYKLSSGFEL